MVIRRHDKNGNRYYFNKDTGKRTSKRAWKISLSHRREKPSYRTRKIDGHTAKIRLGKVRKGISYQKVTSLKKQRNKLYVQRYYWNKKLSELIKNKGEQKKINNAKRKLSAINGKIEKLNRKLGVVYIKKLPPKKKRQYLKNVRTITITHWSGSDELTDALYKGVMEQYIIEGETYPKTRPGDIRMAYNEMVRLALSLSKTPFVVFTYNDTEKIVSIRIY